MTRVWPDTSHHTPTLPHFSPLSHSLQLHQPISYATLKSRSDHTDPTITIHVAPVAHFTKTRHNLQSFIESHYATDTHLCTSSRLHHLRPYTPQHQPVTRHHLTLHVKNLQNRRKPRPCVPISVVHDMHLSTGHIFLRSCTATATT